MNSRLRFLVLQCVACFALLHSSHAVKTERWQLTGSAEFMRGKLQRLIVTSDGDLRLGYENTKLGEFAKAIWCSTVAADGTIYFGTGAPADVYAIGKDDKPARLFETDAIAVTALALDSHGNLFAATMADGKIFKLPAGKDKESTEFCKLRTPYIWALAVDKQDNLSAATGPDGKIFRISPDGKAEEWFHAEESNILCLAFDADGALLAGGSDRGLLYRITEKDKGVVLHEFSEDEIKSIAVSGHDVFVGVNKQKVKRPRAATARKPNAQEFEDLTQRLTAQFGARTGGEAPEGMREAPPEARIGNLQSGGLYQRQANGRVDRLAMWDNESVMQLALDGDRNVLVATAGQGRVYRVPNSQHWEMLCDMEEQQALTLAVRAGHLAFIGTGNVGSGYTVAAQKANDGEATSEVHDCKFLTTWGNLSWMGSGAVSVATRTGNTALPDKSWSDWSALLEKSPAKVSSPRGRFIQIRAKLSNASAPVLKSVDVYFQVQNQKPEVSTIDVGDKPKTAPEKPKADQPGEAKTDSATALPASSAETQRPKPASPAKKLSWHASDKDGDTLVFRLFYQTDGDELWIPVSLEKPLTKSEHTWDTDSIPDGWYRIKVVASDEESNTPGESLSDEKASDIFKIDNRPPEVAQLAIDPATTALTGVARDSLSLIRYLEYSVDGGEWKFFGPKDGVFDDREETFEVKLPKLEPGPHSIAVRATDEEGNVGVEKIALRIK